MSITHKKIQNRVAESGYTLPVTAAYALLIWLLSGMVDHGWWLQMGSMALCTYLLVELSNNNALLRIRSRMVSSCFLVLCCAANFMFPDTGGGVVSVLMVVALRFLFSTYQDKRSEGRYYYAFLALGAATLFRAGLLYFVPPIWVLCLTQLQSLTYRSWTASLLGLLTPYWFLLPWLTFTNEWSRLTAHLAQLADLSFPISYAVMSSSVVLTLSFVVVLFIIGMVHFWLRLFEDRIHIRQLYGFFGMMGIATLLCLLLQPQHYSLLLRLLILYACPFVAHFFTLTNSRLTNIVFLVSVVLSVLITVLNLLA